MRTRIHRTIFRGAAIAAVALAPGASRLAARDNALDIGDHRQLFVDHYLIARLDGLTLELHPPVRREIVLVRDRPWEGSGSDFERLIHDGDLYKLYYMGNNITNEDGSKLEVHRIVACYAESLDGIHWVKPDLGLVEFTGEIEESGMSRLPPATGLKGSKHNNIVFSRPRLDNFTPFKDINPDCPPDERYKALSAGGQPRGLFAYKSQDGIHWSYLAKDPIMTGLAFDTQNNAFWDARRRHYWAYLRGYHRRGDPEEKSVIPANEGEVTNCIRDIRVSTSPDFRSWTKPAPLAYADGEAPALYTNQIEAYYRAPEILLGFPTRYNDRNFTPAALAALPDPTHRRGRMKFSQRYGTVVTDGLFMSSRDGYSFRLWREAFIRPGPERRDNWLYGDGYQSLGLIETPADDPTAPHELSCYATEDEWKRPTRLRRYTIRIDGFVSVHAPFRPGEIVTKPLAFSSGKLSLNFATSGAGSIRVGIERADGTPLPGFSERDCDELFGDTLDRTVTWGGRSDVSAFANTPVRLRFKLSDADLYSLRFRD